MCIAVFRSVGTVAPRALRGLTGPPAGYPRLAQRESGHLCLGDTLRDTLRDTLSLHWPLRIHYTQVHVRKPAATPTSTPRDSCIMVVHIINCDERPVWCVMTYAAKVARNLKRRS